MTTAPDRRKSAQRCPWLANLRRPTAPPRIDLTERDRCRLGAANVPRPVLGAGRRSPVPVMPALPCSSARAHEEVG